jgi:hypothetical protein
MTGIYYRGVFEAISVYQPQQKWIAQMLDAAVTAYRNAHPLPPPVNAGQFAAKTPAPPTTS